MSGFRAPSTSSRIRRLGRISACFWLPSTSRGTHWCGFNNWNSKKVFSSSLHHCFDDLGVEYPCVLCVIGQHPLLAFLIGHQEPKRDLKTTKRSSIQNPSGWFSSDLCLHNIIVNLKLLNILKQMVFGQVVIGPPGSGKTTYCNGMSQFLKLLGRKVAVINLDPANDALPYECAINIEDLIKLSDVMQEHSLGPNGGLVYCMDYLEKNIDWLESRLTPLLKDHYFLFDFPGQVELFFLHSNAKKVMMKLINKLNLRLTAVHLVDAHLCSDPGKYVSALLLSLSTMVHLELPHINVLSKIDLIESYGKLALNLDFYTDVQDLSYLQYHLDQDSRSAKYRKLTKALCEVVEDFGLVNFTTLDIQSTESVGNLVKLIDKSNGYIYAGIEGSVVEFSKIAAGPLDWDYYRVAAVQEKYMKDDHES